MYVHANKGKHTTGYNQTMKQSRLHKKIAEAPLQFYTGTKTRLTSVAYNTNGGWRIDDNSFLEHGQSPKGKNMGSKEPKELSETASRVCHLPGGKRRKRRGKKENIIQRHS